MLIDDIKKIQKLRTKLDEHPEYAKKISQIEKKYILIKNIEGDIKAVYIDTKHNAKVAVFESGSVVQLEGPRVNPNFLSYLFAYLILLMIGLPVSLTGMIMPALQSTAQSINLVLTLASLVLNILTLVHCKDTLKKHKLLFFLLGIVMTVNIKALSFNTIVLDLLNS